MMRRTARFLAGLLILISVGATAHAADGPSFRFGLGDWIVLLLPDDGGEAGGTPDIIVTGENALGYRKDALLNIGITLQGDPAGYVVEVAPPPGMIYEDGILTGRPGGTGVQQAQVTVRDGEGSIVVSETVTLDVFPELSVTFPTSVEAEVDEAVDVAPQVENVIGGNQGAVTWSLLPSEEDLPTGLSFEDTTGSIQGSAADPGTYEDFRLLAVDQSDWMQAQSAPFNIVVSAVQNGAAALYGASGWGQANDSVLGPDGSVYLSTSVSPTRGELLKILPDGTLDWSREITGTISGIGRMTATASGIYFVAGTHVGLIDYSGSIVWTRSLTVSGAQFDFYAVRVSGDTLYVAGSTYAYPRTKISYASISLSTQTVNWMKAYQVAGIYSHTVAGLEILPDGLLMAANLTYSGSTQEQHFLLRTDLAGAPSIARSWVGTQQSHAGRMSTDSAGNIYISGFNHRGGLLGYSNSLAKFSSTGNFLWARGFGEVGNMLNYGHAVDGGVVYVTGTANSGSPQGMLVAAIDSSGSELWSKTFDFTGANESASTITFDSDNLFVGGRSDNGMPFIVIPKDGDASFAAAGAPAIGTPPTGTSFTMTKADYPLTGTYATSYASPTYTPVSAAATPVTVPAQSW